ncbi:MAG TPA: hypothetical protein VF631_14075 [Allosphingosinicella sp.]|jgi:hypothetical protein|uniref:hypothetical protein n=1 Tax=Allosphingosinicella sp. TaxID=2823234 RepID=UPI002F2A3509
MVVAGAAVLIFVRLVSRRVVRVDCAVFIVVVVLVRSDGSGDVRERMHVPRRCGRRDEYREESAEKRMPWPTDEVHQAWVDRSPSFINPGRGP